MFENQPRARTFLQGAWREFGYVYLLRSAASVTPAEYRQFKRSGRNFTGLLIRSAEQFTAQLKRPLPGPSRQRWHVFTNVGPRAVWVRDWYGSYPPRTFLCHGNIWEAAVDMLLDRADLVVLDLSGMMPANKGVRYEVQRVINRIPIDRVIFLADRRSDRNYLHAEIGRVEPDGARLAQFRRGDEGCPPRGYRLLPANTAAARGMDLYPLPAGSAPLAEPAAGRRTGSRQGASPLIRAAADLAQPATA